MAGFRNNFPDHRRLSKTTFRVTVGYECKFPAEGLLEGFSQFNRSKQIIYYGFSSQKDSLKFYFYTFKENFHLGNLSLLTIFLPSNLLISSGGINFVTPTGNFCLHLLGLLHKISKNFKNKLSFKYFSLLMLFYANKWFI